VKSVLLTFAVMLLLALPIGPLFAAADPDNLVSDAAERLGLQTEMPEPQSGPLAELPGSRSGPQAQTPGPKSDLQAESPGSTVHTPDDHAFNLKLPPSLLRLLLWGAVIAGTLVIAWSLRDSLPVVSRSRKIIAAEPIPPPLTRSGRMEEVQVEADDLARQGHYGQAMHLLLLKSLDEIRRQLGTRFAASLTSREILRRVQLSDIGRRSLTAIIRSVEQTYFGGEEAGQTDYSDCRTNFETLKHSLIAIDTA
jgi:hypothetical protein